MTGHPELPSIRVDVVERQVTSRRGWLRCVIGTALQFDTPKMQSYFFARWEPVLYDALLVAAAVEYCDRVRRRPSLTWGRDVQLRVPVHEPDLWNGAGVHESLRSALELLTGDRWQISFRGRRQPEPRPPQTLMELAGEVSAVMPYSDGLDSLAVATILSKTMGETLVRVRLGSAALGVGEPAHTPLPFMSLPYRVRIERGSSVESSVRSRGFKFATLSGLAAYLSGAPRILMPESGQGALGSALVPVGQGYPDYRNHPLFTSRMQRFLFELLGHDVRFEFPQLWLTKGETLAQYAKADGHASGWERTRSCWQQSRQVSVAGRRRQCGVCAACLLRRMSLHAAGLAEADSAYVWEDLRAVCFEAGAALDFRPRGITTAMREYAIAGVLHCDQLARLRNATGGPRVIDANVFQLSRTCRLPDGDVRARLDRLLRQHETEWRAFLDSLGPDSFLAEWACEA